MMSINIDCIKPNLHPKVVYTFSVLALLLTLSSHKDSLNEFGFNYLSEWYSIYDVLLGMATILFLSVYVSAVKILINTELKISLKYLLYCGLIRDIYMP